jgi:hypothetical protein
MWQRHWEGVKGSWALILSSSIYQYIYCVNILINNLHSTSLKINRWNHSPNMSSPSEKECLKGKEVGYVWVCVWNGTITTYTTKWKGKKESEKGKIKVTQREGERHHPQWN